MGKKERSSPSVSSGRVIGYRYYLCCYYWLKTTETDCLAVLQCRSLKSRSGQGHTLSEACRGVLWGLWLASDGLLAISDVPWLVGASPQSLRFSKMLTVWYFVTTSLGNQYTPWRQWEARKGCLEGDGLVLWPGNRYRATRCDLIHLYIAVSLRPKHPSTSKCLHRVT